MTLPTEVSTYDPCCRLGRWFYGVHMGYRSVHPTGATVADVGSEFQASCVYRCVTESLSNDPRRYPENTHLFLPPIIDWVTSPINAANDWT